MWVCKRNQRQTKACFILLKDIQTIIYHQKHLSSTVGKKALFYWEAQKLIYKTSCYLPFCRFCWRHEKESIIILYQMGNKTTISCVKVIVVSCPFTLFVSSLYLVSFWNWKYLDPSFCYDHPLINNTINTNTNVQLFVYGLFSILNYRFLLFDTSRKRNRTGR